MTYFLYDGQYYEQRNGTVRGNPLLRVMRYETEVLAAIRQRYFCHIATQSINIYKENTKLETFI